MIDPPVAILWAIAVLWLTNGDDLNGGHTLMSRETFPDFDACVKALPRYEANVLKNFGSRGVVVCTLARPEATE